MALEAGRPNRSGAGESLRGWTVATSTIVALGLLVLLVGIGLAFAWQESKPSPDPVVVYGTEDALDFIMARLSERTGSRLQRSDVRRILEWEMLYLQSTEHPPGAAVVVGGVEAAEFAQRRALEQGYGYDPASIIDVLDRQAEYLAALGAVGEPVTGDELDAFLTGTAESPDPSSDDDDESQPG